MGFELDPAALLVAVIALWVALRESRRNNEVILRLDDAQTTYGHSIRKPKPAYDFRLLIRNLGVPLHSVQVSLVFSGSELHGRFSIPLKPRSLKSVNSPIFTKGMIAEFGLRSDELDDLNKNLLGELRNPKAQNARFVVYSQGYEAYNFKIGGTFDNLKQRWNFFIYNLGMKLAQRVGTDERGNPIVKPLDILPKVTPLSWPFMNFIDAVSSRRGKVPMLSPKANWYVHTLLLWNQFASRFNVAISLNGSKSSLLPVFDRIIAHTQEKPKPNVIGIAA